MATLDDLNTIIANTRSTVIPHFESLGVFGAVEVGMINKALSIADTAVSTGTEQERLDAITLLSNYQNIRQTTVDTYSYTLPNNRWADKLPDLPT